MNPEIEAVKQQFQIEDIASAHTILNPSGQLLRGKCPFHQEKTPSFFVNPNTGRWRCFGKCSTGWLDVIDFFGWLAYGNGWGVRNPEKFKKVFGQMTDRAGTDTCVQPPPQISHPAYPRVPKSPDAMMLLDRVAAMYESELWKMGDESEMPLTYLRSRGFSETTIRTAHLGYASADGLVKYLKRYGKGVLTLAHEMHLVHETGRDGRAFFRRRIVFPDRDLAGRTIHLCGRVWPESVHSEAAKYLSLKGFAKPLHGFAQLDLASDQPVFIVESPPDRLTLMQWGYDAVATLGTGLTPRNIQSLAALSRPLLYLPHNDGGTGLKAAISWQSDIGKGRILALPEQVKDVNNLACWPDGQAIFHTLASHFLLKH
jgi:DNA primase